MPVNLDAPLSWTKADPESRAMLDQLQANILQAHVRFHLRAVFVRFESAAAGRVFLRQVAPLVKSAWAHLSEVAAFNASQSAGTTYVGVGLTRSSYELFEVVAPSDPAFNAGMKARQDDLTDPPSDTWDACYQASIHAVVIIGDAKERMANVEAMRDQIVGFAVDGVTVVGEETGLGQERLLPDGSTAGIEHFGYVDGRSQPLFLDEQIAKEPRQTWDPAFPLRQIIVPDPGVPIDASVAADACFGSYFVFRKLEQNVRAFKLAEDALADALGLVGADRERAGAMVVGRFEDGTPITVQATGGPTGVPNDFGYAAADAAGDRCPFHAHIRKTNPRGTGGFEPEADERRHLMARRGQTYGNRTDRPDADVEASERPTGDVGLLFMAFNSDIANQFEFTQHLWANNAAFPSGRQAGLDDVIGQGPRAAQSYPTAWGQAARADGGLFRQAVTLKGGEYFFMPSLLFLYSL